MWALAAYGIARGRAILTFFLVCIVIAGVYGAATANPRILFVQAVPAVLALAAVHAAKA